MMSSQGSDQKDVFEFRESIEDIVEITFLQTEKFTVVTLSRNKVILINDLEYEADISEVTSFFQRHNRVLGIFVVHFDGALIYEVYSLTNIVVFQNTISVVDVFIR